MYGLLALIVVSVIIGGDLILQNKAHRLLNVLRDAKNRKSFLVFLFLLLSLTFAETSISGEPSRKFFREEKYNFSFQYPSDWQAYSPDEIMGKTGGLLNVSKNTVVFIANPKDYDQNISIQVIAGKPQGSLNEKQVKDIARKLDGTLPTQFPAFTKLSERVRSVAGRTALEYTFKSSCAGIQIQQRSIMFLANGKSFIITCTSKEPDFKKLDEMVIPIVIGSFDSQ